MTVEEFQCDKAEEAYAKRNDSEVAIKMRRIKHSCRVLKDEVKVAVGMIGYHSCLCYSGYKYPLIGGLIQLRDAYEKGMLPTSGGVLDQSSHSMELLNLINRLYSEYEVAQQQKIIDEQKRKG
jgi:hypothetical protein